VLAVGLVAMLSGVVGCGTRYTPAASSTLPAEAIIDVPGYTYAAPSDDLKLAKTGLGAPGMVTTVARSVQDESGTDIATFVLAQYNAKLTVIGDKKDPNEILYPMVQKLKDQFPGKVTFPNHVLSGTPVRVAQVGKLSIAFAYMHGGQMIMVTGGAPSPLNFTRAYLKARANG
jgi:hypothetical protein